MTDTTDITKRRRAEEQIRFQRRLLDAVGQAIIATDLQGQIIYWNRAAEELYGWSREEVMGRPIVEVTPSAEMLERAEEIMSELRAGRSWSGEFVVRRKDGTSFPAIVTDTPLHDEQGNLMGMIAVSMDVSELKKTEELRRSEERNRALFESNPLPMWVYDPDSLAFLAVNDAAVRHYGYARDEFLAMTVKDLLPP